MNFLVICESLLKIIHNYGHGGNGISLSRGTAVHAVNLMLDADLEINLKSKL